jgi:hypothetical protein
VLQSFDKSFGAVCSTVKVLMNVRYFPYGSRIALFVRESMPDNVMGLIYM